MEDTKRPVLIYDGDCNYCAYQVRYWQRLTGDAVDYQPYQALAGRYPEISPEEFTLQQFSTCMNYAPVGAIRVSVGIASNEADIDALIAVLRTFIDAEPDLTVRQTIPTYVGP